ncbi:helix-turn-helix domain-containing protein [Rouxiella badensis]|jgi:AraC family L-rhamnose operon regulatory protein RhaS|uniref:helix-turn-helix domain-containing protein n=2 Tax=Rouxiella badensis TaxID=1646377 RepID=UPI0004771259|nr:helix-turn-helix domain-containing protein [Rouxiella badensis]MCC3703528.1 helix-turn-helix domain-containing protein [Rouxiella badensis]MCC3719287.1 helix-turn-helix domain-containing protein [Rouxiella badensis]MCC3728537.1 helix-turn-helix domain-containing protein [Rouxiella badensis]MCC3739467.1 helix-turn-helix domain-containing protein [Rouxiella badensis]MCC3747423.1 helix-turn-helix domain-containing protein [Rouxiella badensis]
MERLKVEDFFPSFTEKLSVYSSDPEDNNKEHCHDFNELVIVDSGHGLHVINDQPVFIQEGDVFLIRQNDYHFYEELGTLKLTNVLINPHSEFKFLRDTDSLLAGLAASECSRYGWLLPEVKEECSKLVSQMFNAGGNDDKHLRSLKQEGLFFQLIMSLLSHPKTNYRHNTQYKLHCLLAHLQEHCLDEIDWAAIADEFLLTQRTLFRHIKQTTGMTPENYLKRLRLVSARAKLKNTEDSITDVAFTCGFSNSNHFTTTYKQAFGLTPTQERRRVSG